MLGKLIKYDLKALAKILAPLWGGTLSDGTDLWNQYSVES